MCGLLCREVRAEALYGVRSSSIGAFFAPLGITMNVSSFTPSRIGIFTSRVLYSKVSWFGSNFAGVSPPESVVPVAGVGGICAFKLPAQTAEHTRESKMRHNRTQLRTKWNMETSGGWKLRPAASASQGW